MLSRRLCRRVLSPPCFSKRCGGKAAAPFPTSSYRRWTKNPSLIGSLKGISQRKMFLSSFIFSANFQGIKRGAFVISYGPGGFRELQEAWWNHFHPSWYLSDSMMQSYGPKACGDLFPRLQYMKAQMKTYKRLQHLQTKWQHYNIVQQLPILPRCIS